MLFISWFLHQTTTAHRSEWRSMRLFISWFLHQTTTSSNVGLPTLRLFISWFLHQTTTLATAISFQVCCLSLDSYIKPQPRKAQRTCRWVVYLLIPTSNHNSVTILVVALGVVYLLIPTSNHNGKFQSLVVHLLFISWFLHQTTTSCTRCSIRSLLFISWFLHQTTTNHIALRVIVSCLSLDSYIKPQPYVRNGWGRVSCLSLDSYIKPQPCLCLWSR